MGFRPCLSPGCCLLGGTVCLPVLSQAAGWGVRLPRLEGCNAQVHPVQSPVRASFSASAVISFLIILPPRGGLTAAGWSQLHQAAHGSTPELLFHWQGASVF